MNWSTFWEQFATTIDDKKELSNVIKLAYLREALKDGPAKDIIAGLSQSGDYYKEAVECLRKHYDKPRVVHQAHFRALLDIPIPREGDDRDLRRFHDIAVQHIHMYMCWREGNRMNSNPL